MRSLTVLAAGLLLVAACSKPKPEPEPPPPPPPPPLAVESVDLGKAVGPDMKVTNSMDTFGLRDTIYASVSTSGTATSGELTAKWTFDKTGQTVDSTSVTIAPTGPAVTEFHIMKKTAWPVGKYKVAILLNGGQAKEKEFEVKK